MIRILLSASWATYNLVSVEGSVYQPLILRELQYAYDKNKSEEKKMCKKNEDCPSKSCVRSYCKPKEPEKKDTATNYNADKKKLAEKERREAADKKKREAADKKKREAADKDTGEAADDKKKREAAEKKRREAQEKKKKEEFQKKNQTQTNTNDPKDKRDSISEDSTSDNSKPKPKPTRRTPIKTKDQAKKECESVKESCEAEEDCKKRCNLKENCAYKWKKCIAVRKKKENEEVIEKPPADEDAKDKVDRPEGGQAEMRASDGAATSPKRPGPKPAKPEEMAGCDDIEGEKKCLDKKATKGACKWHKTKKVCFTNPNLGICEKLTRLGTDKSKCKGDCEWKAEACVHPAATSKCLDFKKKEECAKLDEECKWFEEKSVCWRLGMENEEAKEKLEKEKKEKKEKEENGPKIGNKTKEKHVKDLKQKILKKLTKFKNRCAQKAQNECARACEWKTENGGKCGLRKKKSRALRKKVKEGFKEIDASTSFPLTGVENATDEQVEKKVKTALEKAYPGSGIDLLNVLVFEGVDTVAEAVDSVLRRRIRRLSKLLGTHGSSRRRLAVSNSVDVEYILTTDEANYDQLVLDTQDPSKLQDSLEEEMQDIGTLGEIEADGTPMEAIEEDEDFLDWENWTEGCAPHDADDCVLNGCYWSGSECLADEETFDEAVEYEQELEEENKEQETLIIIICCAAGGGLLLMSILVFAVFRCRRKSVLGRSSNNSYSGSIHEVNVSQPQALA